MLRANAFPNFIQSREAQTESAYLIRQSFEPTDFLALVLIDRKRQTVLQHLEVAQRIASVDGQHWLFERNVQGHEIFLSINALRPNASGRSKAHIGKIRHIFLDLDKDAPASLERICESQRLPRPNTIINTSPNRVQLLWRVEKFQPEQAETLQRGLAREWGGDIAATDCARVMRLPGFENLKYQQKQPVHAVRRHDLVTTPSDFPVYGRILEALSPPNRSNRSASSAIRTSQSERDWAYALRALTRGEQPYQVMQAIASFRSQQKSNPRYYARLTVTKAQQVIAATQRDAGRCPER